MEGTALGCFGCKAVPAGTLGGAPCEQWRRMSHHHLHQPSQECICFGTMTRACHSATGACTFMHRPTYPPPPPPKMPPPPPPPKSAPSPPWSTTTRGCECGMANETVQPAHNHILGKLCQGSLLHSLRDHLEGCHHCVRCCGQRVHGYATNSQQQLPVVCVTVAHRRHLRSALRLLHPCLP